MQTKRNKIETPVTDFLDSYKNKKTRENYRVAITHFLHMVCKPSRSGKFAEPNVLALRYFHALKTKERNYYRDLKDYAYLLTEKYAPTTTHLYLSNTILWLEESRFTLTKRERARLIAYIPAPKPKTAEIELKRKTLCAVYDELPERMRTLLQVMLGSGMRLGETLKLKITDLNWDGERTEVTIPAEITKTKLGRTTFLTEEASVALLNYLRKRTDNDERLFPFNPESPQYYLRKVSKELELNNDGECAAIHWHMTRKWFISRFTLAASKDVAEHIAGHEGYLSTSYRRYTKKQILKQFIKAEKKLIILDKNGGQNGLGGI